MKKVKDVKYVVKVTLKHVDGPPITDENAVIEMLIEHIVDRDFWVDDTLFTLEAELA